VPHGYLASPSVKRLGVVTLTDIAPTVLDAMGARVPRGMVGHALRYHPGPADLGRLRTIDRDADYRERIYQGTTTGYVVGQGVLYLLAVVALSRRRRPGRLGGVVRVAMVMAAAFPLATFLFRAVPDSARVGGLAVLVVIDLLVAGLALRARRHPLSPLAWVTGATVALILVDVATGARLQASSLLGYSFHTAARFFGIGNSASAVLAGATILAACIHVAYAPRRRDALTLVGALFVAVVVVDGAPTLGDDLGGILTLVPVLGLTLFALSGRRVTWRSVAVIAAVTVAVVGAATFVDLLRPPEGRTHLGRFASELLSGDAQGGTTIARKVATNIRVLTGTTWAWMVPITLGFLLLLLVAQDRAAELLPPRSPLHVGLVATLAAGALGFAANDSGVLIPAILFLYVGPCVTLLALAPPAPKPMLLGPE
jgi:hypothetical protein